VFVDFLELLDLEPHGPDTFVGTGPQYPWGGLYGGQIVAQGLHAAAATVEDVYRVHSLHAYFIRAGDATEPIRFEVDRDRNGRSFCTRRVVVRQSVGAILNLAASFHRGEPGPQVQPIEMSGIPAADTLPLEGSWSPLLERRFVTRYGDGRPGRSAAWFRLAKELPGDPVVHACALAYLSDDLPTDAVAGLHPRRLGADSNDFPFWSASLDHAIWFHHPIRADEWHLHDVSCVALTDSRGLTVGYVFDAAGLHVATVTQEVLLREARKR
jgi:acyl-CoA thioesterase-2